MKISVENLGVLRKAEFEVGDLTIICGANNTGKTYATYALHGFLDYWQEAGITQLLTSKKIKELLKKGVIEISLSDIVSYVQRVCYSYHNYIPMFFATSKEHFVNTRFDVILPEISIDKIDKTITYGNSRSKLIYNINKNDEDKMIKIFILEHKGIKENKVNIELLKNSISRDILSIIYYQILPIPFAISIERTGAAMFRKELDFTRNRLLAHISNPDSNIAPTELLNTYYKYGYPVPVNKDVDFIRGLEDIGKNIGEIAKKNPEIISLFNSITGGKYKSSIEGLYFIPDKSNAKLTMGDSSSSIRSLLSLGFYIKHLAKPNDLLMLDEPELNLHPQNQRKLARLLARLVNAGVKVYITTHSDYILKEFNTLILMKNQTIRKAQLLEKYGYHENELLDSNRIKAYIAKKALVEVEDTKKKQKINTFVKAPITQNGIEIDEFDTTINDMNVIQDDLLFGGINYD